MKASGFDSIAKVYRWAEYVCLGPLLQKTRTHHLPALAECHQALLLGDGDGRFTAALLQTYPLLRATAVDASGAMLEQVRKNVGTCGGRLETCLADALDYQPKAGSDLVVTHFFLDCLTQQQVNELVERMAGLLPVGGLWLFSDFRIPDGGMRIPAAIYIRALYLAFRLLTGLRVQQLPDHRAPLIAAGLQPLLLQRFLFGMLTTEVWRKAE